ncbi:MAG: tRNA guanosine(34) transglycosylase Tgt [Candidatus Kapaibacteriales bacterium]
MFELIKEDGTSKARLGKLSTDHGEILTPVFMPVGTQGAVKAIEQRELLEIGSQIILGNTYHLYLRPGTEVIEHFGGLHKFNSWEKPILTDSGGYQIFSLKEIRKLTDDGAEFKSHLDGSLHFFSPEKVIEIQKSLGSDIMMVLDECPEGGAERDYIEKSIKLSLKWAERCKSAHLTQSQRYDHRQFLFGIGQGGRFADLRRDYIKRLIDIDFDGYSIGGLSVGEPKEVMHEMTDVSTDVLPKNKARYLMGVGTPIDLLEGVERGVDMFDCVLPTRNARNGQIFTTRGKINIRNAKHKLNEEPIDPGLDNYASRNFSLGYLRHLIIANEILGLQLASIQNIAFYHWLMEQAKTAIRNDNYAIWKKKFIEEWERGE